MSVPHRLAAGVLAVFLVLPLRPSWAQAQGAAAATYMERYNELTSLRPDARKVADVRHFAIGPEFARMTLDSGTLALLTPVGGRTAGAVFQGSGRVHFSPPLAVERVQLESWNHAPVLDDSVTSVVVLFADSLADALERLPLAPGRGTDAMAADVARFIEALKGREEGEWNGGVMEPLLNGERTGMIVALISRSQGDPVLLEINPDRGEDVRLYRTAGHEAARTIWIPVVSFASPSQDTTPVWMYRERLAVPAHRLDIHLTEAFNANLDLAGTAALSLAAAEPLGPWLRFALDARLRADSVRWGGQDAAFFKAEHGGTLWVRSPRRLARGDTATLTVYYHGQMIDRYGDFFFVAPEAAWFPMTRDGSGRGSFDMTFHAPLRYPLVAVGDCVDSAVADRVKTTHWVTSESIDVATFNLGLFEDYHVRYEDAPRVDVMLSEEAHAALRRGLGRYGALMTQQAHMRENVAIDVSNALKVFTHLFGAPPDTQFWVTEIPFGEGVSFPGLIDLSWGTFQNTSIDGFDEWFRAHEVAHQWWGNAVRPASYRDAWLSEGLASYSALWFLQFERNRQGAVDRFLDEYRRDILEVQHAGAVGIGFRAATPEHNGYQALTYEKGAWVFQMLRMLMIDVRTMNTDAFTTMMSEFYQRYRGRSVSAADFRQFVESRVHAPMAWFFDQWVDGDAIPTYRVAWRSEATDDGRYRVHFRIHQEGVLATFRMPVLVAADLGEHRVGHFRINVTGTQTDYVGPPLPAPVRSLVFGDQHAVLADVRMEGW